MGLHPCIVSLSTGLKPRGSGQCCSAHRGCFTPNCCFSTPDSSFSVNLNEKWVTVAPMFIFNRPMLLFLNENLHLLPYLCVSMPAQYSTLVINGQLSGVSSPLLPMCVLGLKQGCQAWQHVPLPAEPSLQSAAPPS